MKQIKKLIARQREISNEIARRIVIDLPIGSVVTWRHGSRLVRATVVDHSRFNRVKLEGTTGRQYWKDIYCVESVEVSA